MLFDLYPFLLWLRHDDGALRLIDPVGLVGLKAVYDIPQTGLLS
jgi:hypothetical protein